MNQSRLLQIASAISVGALSATIVFGVPRANADTQAEGDWLVTLNGFRAEIGLPLVTEDAELSAGAALHSAYLVYDQPPTELNVNVECLEVGPDCPVVNEAATVEGARAARASVVRRTVASDTADSAAVEAMFSSVFDGLDMMSPRVQAVGFGSTQDAAEPWGYAAALDVRSRQLFAAQAAPIIVPVGTIGRLVYTGGESPDPLSPCSGYGGGRPSGGDLTGAPAFVYFDKAPTNVEVELLENGVPVEVCAYSEHPNANANAALQVHSAAVIIPRAPLVAGATYSISVDAEVEGDEVTATHTFVANGDAGTPADESPAQRPGVVELEAGPEGTRLLIGGGTLGPSASYEILVVGADGSVRSANFGPETNSVVLDGVDAAGPVRIVVSALAGQTRFVLIDGVLAQGDFSNVVSDSEPLSQY